MSKTVKVRVAVMMNPDGTWCAAGYDRPDAEVADWMFDMFHEAGEDAVLVAHITAEIPIPTPQEVAADVEVKG